MGQDGGRGGGRTSGHGPGRVATLSRAGLVSPGVAGTGYRRLGGDDCRRHKYIESGSAHWDCLIREDDGAAFLAAACGPTPPASLPAPLPALPGRVVLPYQAPMTHPG